MKNVDGLDGLDTTDTTNSSTLLNNIKDTINIQITTPLKDIDTITSGLKDLDNIKSSIYNNNYNKNNLYINNTIRLNNLKKIDRYKEIHLIVMYIILFITCGLFVYFYKNN